MDFGPKGPMACGRLKGFKHYGAPPTPGAGGSGPPGPLPWIGPVGPHTRPRWVPTHHWAIAGRTGPLAIQWWFCPKSHEMPIYSDLPFKVVKSMDLCKIAHFAKKCVFAQKRPFYCWNCPSILRSKHIPTIFVKMCQNDGFSLKSSKSMVLCEFVWKPTIWRA